MKKKKTIASVTKTLATPLFCLALPLIACSNTLEIPTMQPQPNVTDTTTIKDNVSGDYYDWTVTGKPERPYINDYTQCMFMKFDVAYPDNKGGSNVVMNYEQALDNIKKIDAVTRGVKKIVYLVGYQYNGHDTGYPALSLFNKALKREQDATPRASYLWLKKEAAKYNTIVSVHTNLNDAWMSSPLWHTYYKNDLLCKNSDGSLVAYGTNKDMYRVNLVKEWKLGYLQKRIDEATEQLDLKSGGTVHLDVFHPEPSPYHNVTMEDVNVVLRKVLRYWRDKGVDVTSEDLWNWDHSRTDPFFGLRPAVWWNNLSEDEHVKVRPQLSAGGECGFVGLPPSQDLGFLFGNNMHAEELVHPGMSFKEFKKQFCEKSLQYFFLNKHELVNYDKANKIAYYSDGVVVSWNDRSVKQNGNLLRQNGDILLPAVWITGHKELIAYSEGGYTNKTWKLPDDWSKVQTVTTRPITENGLGESQTYNVVNGSLTLSMAAGEMYSVQPE